jgi:hypothetical protein
LRALEDLLYAELQVRQNVKHIIAALLFVSFLLASFAWAQTSSENLPQAGTHSGQRPDSDDVKLSRQMRTQQLHELNRQRQEQLKRDTDKLLQLATELKQYVDKTNENILSLEVLKKTDEIDRLAKSVREKMKNAYGDAPQ